MKAYIGMQYHCGECDWVMYREVNPATIECKNPNCSEYNKKYHQPVVELEPVMVLQPTKKPSRKRFHEVYQ